MSLATRCTTCDTVFRVVQDQLKVSEGWVRCGRCNAVFNALEGLFDLEPSPAPVVASTAEPPPVVEEPSLDEAPPVMPEVLVNDDAVEPAFDDGQLVAQAADFDATPASRVAARDRIDFADAQFNSALLAEAGIEPPQPGEDAPGLPTAATPAPEFLRQAEREARWKRPRTVLMLWLLCIVLLVAAALQATLHFRDLLAAMLPTARPALQALCDIAGCRIEPLRRIDDIVIESSALTSAPGGEAVRLSLVLRNRSALPLAMPSIELTLTDVSGQMLARRALSPAEFGATSPTLPAASESALQVVLSTGSRRASGYTVEPFYP